MPDEDDDLKLAPKDSLCIGCRHGMVVYEHSFEQVIMPEVIQGNEFDGEGEQQGLSSTLMPIKQVRSVCTWRGTTPVLLAVVLECNRYEADR